MNKIREIKFRVWDKQDLRFIDCDDKSGVFLIDFNGKLRCAEWSCGNGDNSANSVYEPLENQQRYVIQQYTGLKDILGKDIYEGDIVKYKTRYGNYMDSDKDVDITTNEVVFSDGGFYPQPESHIEEDSYYNYKTYDFEVIGNIFQNPDLLK